MPVLPVTIRNKNAVYTDCIPYVCSNSDYEVVFTFDAEWDQHSAKTVRFSVGGQYVDRIITGNVCPVPVFEDGTILQVGVFAGELHTSTPAVIRMCDSIRSGSGVPADPEPCIYDQLMEKISQLPDALLAAEQAQTAAQNAAKSVSGGAYMAAYVGEDGCLYWSKTDNLTDIRLGLDDNDLYLEVLV